MKKNFTLIFILLLSSIIVMAQDRTITGKVVDKDFKDGLPGTNIIEKGTSNGVTTDVDGNFKIVVTTAQPVLVFSFIGYKELEVSVGALSYIDVVLESDLAQLSEVVVIGYGTQKKSVASTAISKVEGESLERMNLPNVGRNLQGLAAGISVSGASGSPGSNPTILIRGIGTNGDNRPLIVIDGLQDGDLSTLAPADIESIEILKDAASSAIYGTKGANGVIFVTTKKGVKGKASVTYDGSTAIQQPWRTPKMMNAGQYVDLIHDKYNGNPPQGFPALGDPLPVDTDWVGSLFEPSRLHNHHLSFSRNNENGSVYSSVSYVKQEGVIAPEKSNYERFTARFNSQTDINKYVQFGQNLTLVNSVTSSIPENNELGSPLADAMALDPLTPIFDPNAQFGFAQSPFVRQEYVNPFSRIFIANNETNAQNVYGNMYLEVKPIEGLRFRTDIGANFYNQTSDFYNPAYALTPNFFQPASGVAHTSYGNFRWQWENYLSYSKAIGDHNLEFVAGTTAIRFDQKSFAASGQDLPEDALNNPNLRYVDSTPDSTRRSSGREAVSVFNNSLFARVLYNYKERYLFTASLRRDGSSKFGPENRYGVFPAVSAGWVISSESFWDNSMINFLKLRGSYGANGNDRIADLAFSSIIAPNAFTYVFGPAGNQTVYYGGAPVALANPFLRWESSQQLDIGVESRFFGGSLGIELDYFYKQTDGLLIINQSIPIMAGNNPSFSNLGEIRNSGFEFKIDYFKKVGELDFNVSFNGSTLNNVVTNVDGELGFVNGYQWPIRGGILTRMEADLPLYYFRGYQTDGIFRTQEDVFRHINSNGDLLQPNARPGDIRFKDTNGDGVIDFNDWGEIGKPWADFIFGFNFSATYKNFDLGMIIAGQAGNQIYRTFERQDVGLRNYSEQWTDRWSEDNPNGSLPRVSLSSGSATANNESPSDFFVEDGDYLRIRNLQIGYSLPKSILSKAGMNKGRVYFSADNLLTLTKYTGLDPEIGVPNYGVGAAGIDRGFYPQLRSFSGGIQLSF